MKMPEKAVVPQPEELDREFYRATVAAGALCMQHCKQCGTWTHPARYYCPQCSSDEFSFDRVSGDAALAQPQLIGQGLFAACTVSSHSCE